MGTDPYANARELADLFGRLEYAMKRAGFLKSRNNAEADWNSFAQMLGNRFFDEVVRRRIASNLLAEPPRKLMSDLSWQPPNPDPLSNVEQLIVHGVCRVRNSYIHGEKFVGGSGDRKRDAMLVEQSLAVLRLAADFVPNVAEQLAARPA